MTSDSSSGKTHSQAGKDSFYRKKSWKSKFAVAFRGLKMGIRGHSSFSVHFFATAIVLAAGVLFQCNTLEWIALLVCISMVLVAELFNSSIETLFRGLDEETRNRSWPALDIAAGAVLLASLFTALIGLIIFLPRLKAWIPVPFPTSG